MQIAQALNEAIWLRDNVGLLHESEILERVIELDSLDVFSNRQLHAIINGVISYRTLSAITGNRTRTGGRLNVGTLDILKNILYSRANDFTDYKLIDKAIEMGTSQGMISKLTGVSQGNISKRMEK